MLHTRYACLTKGVWPAEGDVLVADRGLCSYAHVALLVQAGVHAVRRVGARQIVDVTPGRPFVRPSVRRTSAELYRQRRRVETSLAQLKTTMQMDVLHGQTVPGMLRELTVFAIVYNMVRMVVCQSARLQPLGVERISFLDALRWLGAPSTGMPLGALIVNPVRPHRVEPRVKKRRPKSFPLMIKPRQELRQQLVQQELRG
jgi:hypothetical protein